MLAVKRYAIGAALAMVGAFATHGIAQASETTIPCGTNLTNVSITAADDGNTYALVQDCTYTGTLYIDANNVTLEGPQDLSAGNTPPVISNTTSDSTYGCDDTLVNGSGDTIQYVDFSGVSTASYHDDDIVGVALGFTPDAQDCEASGATPSVSGDTLYEDGFSGNLWAGVLVNSNADSNTIDDITVTGPGSMDGGGDSGAFGILLWGSSNTIENSGFSGEEVEVNGQAGDYDGSAVEVYGYSTTSPDASNNIVENNTSVDCNNFSELGKNGTSAVNPTGNEYLDNTVTGSTSLAEGGITTRGSIEQDGQVLGPVNSTIINGNSFTNAVTQAYGWESGDGNLVTVENNSFAYTSGPNSVYFTNNKDAGGCKLKGGNTTSGHGTKNTTGCTGSWD